MRPLIIALVLVACAGPIADDATSTTAAPDPVTSTSLPEASTTFPANVDPVPPLPEEPPVTGDTPTSILDPILADAAERTGVPLTALVVVRSQFVEWPDGSLGCPEPGMLYPQVITAGYWVQIDAAGALLDYRAGDSGAFRLCETPAKGVPPGSDPDA